MRPVQMAWIGGHLAIGMVAGGVAAAGVCAIRKRGWKSVPVAMLAGGMWAIIPDLPRVVREDLPNTYLAATFGSRAVGQWLNSYGNFFFFHSWFDVTVHGMRP